MHSLILTEKTSWMEPMPWRLRDKMPRVVPGELVNIIVLMSGFVNVVDMPQKKKKRRGRQTDSFCNFLHSLRWNWETLAVRTMSQLLC